MRISDTLLDEECGVRSMYRPFCFQIIHNEESFKCRHLAQKSISHEHVLLCMPHIFMHVLYFEILCSFTYEGILEKNHYYDYVQRDTIQTTLFFFFAFFGGRGGVGGMCISVSAQIKEQVSSSPPYPVFAGIVPCIFSTTVFIWQPNNTRVNHLGNTKTKHEVQSTSQTEST